MYPPACVCMCMSVFMCVPAWRGTNLHSGSHWYVPHHCLLDLLSLTHWEWGEPEGVRTGDGRKNSWLRRLRQFSHPVKTVCFAQKQQDMAATFIVTSDKQTHTQNTMRTNSQLVLKTGKLAQKPHTDRHKNSCQGSSTEPDRSYCRITALIHAADTTST